MRKLFTALALFTAVLLFQFCSSSKSASSTAAPATTFEANVKPVIVASCAPCHIAGQGNKKSLDNYANAKDYADEMIERIQKNPGDRGFMPMRHPKLSETDIAVFVDWKKSGLQEK